MVVVPRTRVEVFPPPGAPSVVMFMPATRPWRACITFPVGMSATSFILTTATEPVRSAFFSAIYPVTTTSSRKLVSSSRTTLSSPAASSVTVFIPTDEITSFAPAGAVIWKFPSRSVIVPVFVPRIITAAPMTGSPYVLSMTLPLTLISCAEARTPANTANQRVRQIRFSVFIVNVV